MKNIWLGIQLACVGVTMADVAVGNHLSSWELFAWLSVAAVHAITNRLRS